MAVAANALETYDSVTIREDLTDAENMISPTETPFISMIAGSNTATNKYHEWPLLELAAVDTANRVAEGEDAPGVDAPDVAKRRGNYTQISDKVIKVSDTSQQVDGAASIEKLSKQVAYKLKELKRDKEAMLTGSFAADPGASGTPRQAASFVAHIITNRQMGATGVAPTLSAPPNGYIDDAGTPGTAAALSEDAFNAAMQAAWTQGGAPKYALVSPVNKRIITKTFTGYATKYKDSETKSIINAVDVYESDFGRLSIVPSRFMRSTDVLFIDPDYVKVSNLQPTRQLELARTGHTENRLIQSEYTLEVGNEKAHAAIVDTQG